MKDSLFIFFFIFLGVIYEEKIFLVIFTIIFLIGCQANYIRDVQGGTVAPSSSSRLTGIDTK
ncbi:lysis protein [Salmonella enterica]|nr:lysis protein [Salmonella enterica]